MREHETEERGDTKVSDLVDDPFEKDQNSQEEERVWETWKWVEML